MTQSLVIGGTRFIGRHLVEELLAHGHDVTLCNRGTHDNPFADTDGVEHVETDRKERQDLKTAKLAVEPDHVFDTVAFHPQDVRTATEVFADVDSYVYVSSGAAYGSPELPRREGVTELCECTDEQATDDSSETYGNRKAEGDRVVAAAAEAGVNAYSVRPCVVYGPHDYTERLDYWITRVLEEDRVVVPGDGDNIWHRAYVEDVASAMRIVAESGEPGAAYNVGDRRLVTLREMLELIADVADTDVEIVAASERELSAVGLSTEDFVLFRSHPHILATDRLASLGWESTPVREAMARSVEAHRDSDRDGSEHDPGPEKREAVLDVLDTV